MLIAMKASYFLVLTSFFLSPLCAETFVYDDADRLFSETDGRTITYTTDPAGNITNVTVTNPAPLAPTFATSGASLATPSSGSIVPSKSSPLFSQTPRMVALRAKRSVSGKAADADSGVQISLRPIAVLEETGPLNLQTGAPAYWRLAFLGGGESASITTEGVFSSWLSRITLAPLASSTGLSLQMSHLDYFLLGEPLVEWAGESGPWSPLEWTDNADGLSTELNGLSIPSEFFLRVR